MRVLLVTNEMNLAEKLDVLSPELEYCGFVVDNVEPAKETLEKVGLSQVPLYPLSELKTCAESHDYDYAICVQELPYDGRAYKLYKAGFPTEKVVAFANLLNEANWQTERPLRYYQEHAQEIEMFATGISTVEAGIDIRQFKRKAINFGTSSQDLYYNFQIAKHIVLYGGGHNAIRYALIGLAPYSFHFDLSSAFAVKARLLPYFIAFNDLHNHLVPVDIYKKFLREEWLAKKPSIQKVNLNGVKSPRVMDNSPDNNEGLNPWTGRYYPETRDENVKILDDYLTLCETNNIRPIMFMVPVTEKLMAKFNKQLLEEFYLLVEQACQKHLTACFIDGWKLKDFTYDDFYNHEHLNVHGAAKFSAYLNDFIEQLEFNYYKDANNFHNRLNDSIEELEFRNHFGA